VVARAKPDGYTLLFSASTFTTAPMTMKSVPFDVQKDFEPVALAAKAPIPVMGLVRRRSGDFVFSAADIDAMRADIEAMRAGGLAGVVIGASRPDGRLDVKALQVLVEVGRGLSLTLHRAIDLVPDWREAIELAIELGFDRILTSGGAANALDGKQRIGELLRLAGNRITVMAGAHITPANARELMTALPLGEVHSSCAGETPMQQRAIDLGFAAPMRRQTQAPVVAALKRALNP